MDPHLPPAGGLYDPRWEADSCGTGFVADVAGRRSHRVLARALEALGNLAHRGAVSADGLTGDGAGVLTQIPHRLFRRELAAAGAAALDRDDDLAVGVFFLPGDDAEARRAATAVVEEAVARGALRLLAWREVPLGENVLGEKAERTRPAIRQALVARPAGLDDDAFERLLYLTRKRIERRAATDGAGALRPLLLAPHAGLQGADDRLAARGASTPTSSIPTTRARSPSSTSATPPTPSPPGRWRSPSACSGTTARSTPSRATATGCGRASASCAAPPPAS